MNHFYNRCAPSAEKKKKKDTHDHFRRQPSEYYFTRCIDNVIQFLQHTRSDKVRKSKEELKAIVNNCETKKTLSELINEEETEARVDRHMTVFFARKERIGRVIKKQTDDKDAIDKVSTKLNEFIGRGCDTMLT